MRPPPEVLLEPRLGLIQDHGRRRVAAEHVGDALLDPGSLHRGSDEGGEVMKGNAPNPVAPPAAAAAASIVGVV